MLQSLAIHPSLPPMDCVVEEEDASIVEEDVVLVDSLLARTAPRPSGSTLIAPGKSRPLTCKSDGADQNRRPFPIGRTAGICQRLSLQSSNAVGISHLHIRMVRLEKYVRQMQFDEISQDTSSFIHSVSRYGVLVTTNQAHSSIALITS